ncbi:Peptidase family S41 [Chitinophaga rupis]|uniref:Peptidase family S41 n=2 Tax=Chitinophaga rupis TaxID=573321 RepID=A0A1H7RNU7_9BACT|nr:Peptidase family S41 [Chitinophaga rupis]
MPRSRTGLYSRHFTFLLFTFLLFRGKFHSISSAIIPSSLPHKHTGMKKWGILFITLLATTLSTHAQLSKKEIATAVDTIAAIIRRSYVHEDKGAQIATAFQAAHQYGSFNTTTTWKGFDSLATQLLRSISHDGHLYVRNDPATVKMLLAPPDTITQETDDGFHYGPAASENNYGFREVRILDNNIGYIKLSEINISHKSLPVLYAAMQFVAHTRALIIDLQGNGGGGSDIGPVIESFFLKNNTPLLEMKSRNGTTEHIKTVSWLTQEKYTAPLFIMINNRTASAAEALAFCLQAQKRATIIGQRSAGGANMNDWFPVNEQLYVSVSVASPTLPGTTISWEQKGVQPDTCCLRPHVVHGP